MLTLTQIKGSSGLLSKITFTGEDTDFLMKRQQALEVRHSLLCVYCVCVMCVNTLKSHLSVRNQNPSHYRLLENTNYAKLLGLVSQWKRVPLIFHSRTFVLHHFHEVILLTVCMCVNQSSPVQLFLVRLSRHPQLSLNVWFHQFMHNIGWREAVQKSGYSNKAESLLQSLSFSLSKQKADRYKNYYITYVAIIMQNNVVHALIAFLSYMYIWL